MEFLNYRHVVNMGDLISALPGIRHLHRITGKKAIIYQQLNRPGEYYIGAEHPTKDGNGNMVCFNQLCFDQMRPLLLAQDYIEDFRVYNGEKVDYDLDVVRQQTYCGAPHFPLHKWTWMAYPEMACDLSEDWLEVSDSATAAVSKKIEMGGMRPINEWDLTFSMEGKIILNFTDRYRNFNLNYFFLQKYESFLIFAGMPQERDKFCDQWGLKNVPHLQNKNILELAQAIKSCRFFLGNQSLCWHLAQAMHVPRILELYPFAQNCTNFGANGYEYYHQHQVEFFFEKLFNE